MNTLFFCNNKTNIERAFSPEQRKDTPICTFTEIKESPKPETEYIFSSWEMPILTEIEIKHYFPRLKAVFYGAGSVQFFAPPFLKTGVRIFSAWAANAVPVSEFTAAQIILANKGYFQLHSRYKKAHADSCAYAETFPGNYNTKVGLLGAGMIGRRVIELLKPYELKILVFDPFLTMEQAISLKVEKVSIEKIFSQCQTVSNHLANNEKTREMLNYRLFSLLKDNATFINTGRGAQINVQDLLRAMKEKPCRTALLDVTDPVEPLTPENEYWKYPNIFITPHRAGSSTDEIRRMGTYVYEEYERVLKGEKPKYEVTLSMLETMA